MKRLIVFLVLIIAFLSSCSSISRISTEDEKYVCGTDFGGDIALVGREHESELPALIHSNICINKEGEELFSLPNDWVAAKGYEGKNYTEVPPVNNYIFATDTNPYLFTMNGVDVYEIEGVDFWCKYVLDSQGNILLTPSENDYDYIVTSIYNFKEMVEDGYLIAYSIESTYAGTVQTLKFMTIDGEHIQNVQTNMPYGLSEAQDWEYLGNGLVDIEPGIYDLSTGRRGEASLERINHITSVDRRAYKGNFLLFELEDGYPEIQEFYKGKAGVIYKTPGDYVALVDETGEFLVEPFESFASGVYVHDSGFLVQSVDFDFYDFEGKLIKTVDVPNNLNEIHEYSSGYFRIADEDYDRGGYIYNEVNYINGNGELLF